MSEKNLYQPNLNGNFSIEETEFFDLEIRCIDCQISFVWTIGEQIFFRDKGLKNPPKRCRKCKQAKNERILAAEAAHAAGIRQRIEIAVHCDKCRCYTTVPFYPSQGRPVLCRSCFLEKNANGKQK